MTLPLSFSRASSAVLSTTVATLLFTQSTLAADEQPENMDVLVVTAKRADRISKGATGLNLAVEDTPQSISTVTADEMDRFGADNINDALRLATGINVEEWETNRTNYMARGFEIKNTQIDGIGLPNDWGIVTGSVDSFGFEKIEVIRGANGLLTGVGNSSGTINYVRKRPTNDLQGKFSFSAGSYDNKRIEADYSTPFTDDRSWAGRVVVASEDEDSYLRGMSNDRTFVYGVVDGQLGDKSTVTLGYSYQKANTDGNMWGALVLNYTDGTQADFPRNSNTTQDWASWDTTQQTAFVEYTYALAPSWDLKLTYNHRQYEDDSKLFFVYTMAGLEKDNTGLLGWPGSWPTEDKSNLFDVSLSGRFEMFGREHEAILGTSYSKGEKTQYQRPVDPSDPSWGALPAFPYAGDVIPEPAWGEKIVDGTIDQVLKRGYGATHFEITDSLSALVGFNWAQYHREGQQTGVPFDQTESKWSPYAGLTYNFREHLMAYASYSDIYQPQDQKNINDRYLDASKGLNYEIGVKADWLNRRLLTTLAWFTAEQKGLSTFAGLNSNGNYYYEGVDVKSRGIEAEVTGRLNDYVDLVFGFTKLKLTDEQGEAIYEWVPRRTVNVALSTKVPGYTQLELGLNGRWQSDISTLDSYSGGEVKQNSYALLGLFARLRLGEHASLRANVTNITDEKYITSLYQIGFYGAPRSYSTTFEYSFK